MAPSIKENVCDPNSSTSVVSSPEHLSFSSLSTENGSDSLGNEAATAV